MRLKNGIIVTNINYLTDTGPYIDVAQKWHYGDQL